MESDEIMYVIRDTEDIKSYIGGRKTAVALGAFDGLHIGHKAVVRGAVESGYFPVVFTFWDNPAESLTGQCSYLTTTDERLQIFESWGVEAVVMPNLPMWPIGHRSVSGNCCMKISARRSSPVVRIIVSAKRLRVVRKCCTGFVPPAVPSCV